MRWGARDGLGLLRAIRPGAGPARPAGAGCALLLTLRGAGQLGALACRARCAARRVYGVGQTARRFCRSTQSTAGQAIDTAVARIRQGFLTFAIAVRYHGRARADTLTAPRSSRSSSIPIRTGSGILRAVRPELPLPPGDIELAAKYRVLAGAHYAAAVTGAGPPPDGAKDSATTCSGSRSRSPADLEGADAGAVVGRSGSSGRPPRMSPPVNPGRNSDARHQRPTPRRRNPGSQRSPPGPRDQKPRPTARPPHCVPAAASRADGHIEPERPTDSSCVSRPSRSSW